MQFTASETTSQRLVGLNLGNTYAAGFDIDFAIQLWPDGGVDVRENGVYRAQTTFVNGDVFRIALDSGLVKYYKNGALLYTSANVPTYPLRANGSILNINGTINSVVVGY